MDIEKQKKQSEVFHRTEDRYSVLSYFLNNKIRELGLLLGSSLIYPVTIDALIYNRETKRTF